MLKLRIFIAIIILASNFANVAFAQDKGEIEVDSNKTVYWIYVKAKIKTNRKTQKSKYIVKSIGKKPKSGSLKECEISIWRNMLIKQRLFVGPFFYIQDAKQAFSLYDLKKVDFTTSIYKQNNIKDSLSNYYWFVLPPPPKRIGPYYFPPPVKLKQGNVKEFSEVLWKELPNKSLTIGPFPTKQEAKLARWYYRLEED